MYPPRVHPCCALPCSPYRTRTSCGAVPGRALPPGRACPALLAMPDWSYLSLDRYDMSRSPTSPVISTSRQSTKGNPLIWTAVHNILDESETSRQLAIRSRSTSIRWVEAEAQGRGRYPPVRVRRAGGEEYRTGLGSASTSPVLNLTRLGSSLDSSD